MSTNANTGLFRLLDQIIDGIGGAVDSAANLIGQIVPGAAGAVVDAAGDAVSGVNQAVANFSSGVSAQTTQVAPNPFAGIDLGGVVAGLRQCSLGTSQDNAAHGDFSMPCPNYVPMRQNNLLRVA